MFSWRYPPSFSSSAPKSLLFPSIVMAWMSVYYIQNEVSFHDEKLQQSHPSWPVSFSARYLNHCFITNSNNKVKHFSTVIICFISKVLGRKNLQYNQLSMIVWSIFSHFGFQFWFVISFVCFLLGVELYPVNEKSVKPDSRNYLQAMWFSRLIL